MKNSFLATLALFTLMLSHTGQSGAAKPEVSTGVDVRDAEAFVAKANQQLLELSVLAERAAWVQANFITGDTEILAANAYKNFIAGTMKLAGEAVKFDGLKLPEATARQLAQLKLALTLPAPADPALQTELTTISTGLEATYGKGSYCPKGGECRDLGTLSRTMAKSRNYDELLETWIGWRTISPPMRPRYQRFVELGNQGARDLGFADLGALWRSKYDMPANDFVAEADRIWLQVKPLYDALHAHVRASLVKQYGADKVPADGYIPAHLLGNMWGQSWGNIYDLIEPPKGAGVDLDKLLETKKVDEREMVRYGERFFTSLGFEPLPESFWKRSLFVKPKDREVVCHASAWDVDGMDDLRIKMCIEINGEDFVTVHHELGHNFYQRAYKHQPPLFRASANDGFHEAIGDTIALSVTPDYLVKTGLLDKAPGSEGDLPLLMKQALDKVAFLPFGLLVDRWRWGVFSGEIPPEHYNQGWWDLRRKYQGIDAPVKRSEQDFDPGAKYHIPGNTPYTRYFLAHILQFQFHRAMCRQAGYKGPLHRCSIYGNKEVGARLEKMLAMGSSQPWPDALEALTGEREMDATAILEYFAPLKAWLDEKNRGRKVGF